MAAIVKSQAKKVWGLVKYYVSASEHCKNERICPILSQLTIDMMHQMTRGELLQPMS